MKFQKVNKINNLQFYIWWRPAQCSLVLHGDWNF